MAAAGAWAVSECCGVERVGTSACRGRTANVETKPSDAARGFHSKGAGTFRVTSGAGGTMTGTCTTFRSAEDADRSTIGIRPDAHTATAAVRVRSQAPERVCERPAPQPRSGKAGARGAMSITTKTTDHIPCRVVARSGRTRQATQTRRATGTSARAARHRMSVVSRSIRCPSCGDARPGEPSLSASVLLRRPVPADRSVSGVAPAHPA